MGAEGENRVPKGGTSVELLLDALLAYASLSCTCRYA